MRHAVLLTLTEIGTLADMLIHLREVGRGFSADVIYDLARELVDKRATKARQEKDRKAEQERNETFETLLADPDVPPKLVRSIVYCTGAQALQEVCRPLVLILLDAYRDLVHLVSSGHKSEHESEHPSKGKYEAVVAALSRALIKQGMITLDTLPFQALKRVFRILSVKAGLSEGEEGDLISDVTNRLQLYVQNIVAALEPP